MRAATIKRVLLPSRTTMLLAGLAVGLLLAPRSGRGTRAWIFQKSQRAVDTLSGCLDLLAQKMRRQSNRLEIISSEIRDLTAEGEGETSDQILPQRVKSELGRFFNISDLEIDSQNGIVTIRGEVGNQQEKQNILEMAKRVRGVREVVNMLY